MTDVSGFHVDVASLVDSETENDYPGEDKAATWQKRKEQSLEKLRGSTDIGVKMLWLADKLSNLRSLAGSYGEMGEKLWESLHQSDPAMQLWYYKTVSELIAKNPGQTEYYAGIMADLARQIHTTEV